MIFNWGAIGLIELLALGLSIVSLVLTLSIIIAIRKIGKALRIGLSYAGEEGVQKREQKKLLQKWDNALGEFAIDQVFEQYPEFQVLWAWLQEHYPELTENVTPDILMVLAKKYLPLLQQYLNRGSQIGVTQGGAV
jgi:hypothetical protein